MSGAQSAAEALKLSAQGAWRVTFQAGNQLARAHSAVRSATDVEAVMARIVDLLIAIDTLKETAEAAGKELREAFAQQLQDTGALTVHGTHHSAHIQRASPFVVIDNENDIPTEFRVLKSSIDKRAIAAAIKAGMIVPSASLATPNKSVLVIKARQETKP